VQIAGPRATAVAVDANGMALSAPWQGMIYRMNDSTPRTTIRDMTTHPISIAIAIAGQQIHLHRKRVSTGV